MQPRRRLIILRAPLSAPACSLSQGLIVYIVFNPWQRFKLRHIPGERMYDSAARANDITLL